jgi:predicted lipid-binding transport protein (Tim44 family)
MSSGGFPIDIVLFAMIAAFLVLRLRSILGRRTGFEPPPAPVRPAAPGPIVEGRAVPVDAPRGRLVPEPASALGQTLVAMRAIDRTFDPARFLDGAEQAFRLIVLAYAKGDRASLEPLLGHDIFAAFNQGIAAREAAGETQRTEIRGIQAATITDASLRGSVAEISVRFVSDQISLTSDAAGHPVHGTDAVTELTDLWTFERDLAIQDPTWRLVSAHSA